MKVKELISHLQKMPQNSVVYTADSDHSEWETNSKVTGVYRVNQKNFDEWIKNRLQEEPCFKIEGTYVVIRT